MENIRSVHQKPLDRLGLCLAVGVPVVDGSGLVIAVGAVREADIVKLDLVEAHQLRRLHRKVHLVLPGFPAIGRGPVGSGQLPRLALFIGDGVFRMVLDEIGVVKGGDSADHIVACIFQLLDRRLIFLHGIEGSRCSRRTILLHYLRGISNRAAIDNIHNKGIDTAVVGNFNICVHIIQTPCYQIEGSALLRHCIAINRALFPGIVVKVRRPAATVQICAACVGAIVAIVIVGKGFRFGGDQIPGHDIALLFPQLYPIHMGFSILCQVVATGDRHRRAL